MSEKKTSAAEIEIKQIYKKLVQRYFNSYPDGNPLWMLNKPATSILSSPLLFGTAACLHLWSANDNNFIFVKKDFKNTVFSSIKYTVFLILNDLH